MTLQPRGTEEILYGLNTYVSPGEPENGILVLISDATGWNIAGLREVADKISTGSDTTVYVPEFLSADFLPSCLMDTLEDDKRLTFMEKAKWNLKGATAFGPWIFRHREAISWPIINGYFENLHKDKPGQKIVAGGFAWGGRYALLLTHQDRWMSGGAYREGGFVQAAFAAYPLFLTLPKEISAIARPARIVVGDHDMLISMKTINHVKSLVAKKKETIPDMEVQVYEGAQHGFALKTDVQSPMQKQNFEDFITQTIDWVKKYAQK